MQSKTHQLAALHDELRQCRRCLEEGYWIETGPVFSGGAGAQVMLIGQAPGITEGQVKRPFNAGSGRRLFQWLGEAGWDETEFRANAYMTAVTKCYPGSSKNGKGDRVPTPFEQALCRPWLDQEIRLINPRLMLLVGGLAIKLLHSNSTRLHEIVGTTAYFPPEALAADPLNFDLSQAEIIRVADDSQTIGQEAEYEIRSTIDGLPSLEPRAAYLERRSVGGRFVVPLPHPSGVSLWHNRKENQLLIKRAVNLLADIRTAYDL